MLLLLPCIPRCHFIKMIGHIWAPFSLPLSQPRSLGNTLQQRSSGLWRQQNGDWEESVAGTCSWKLSFRREVNWIQHNLQLNRSWSPTSGNPYLEWRKQNTIFWQNMSRRCVTSAWIQPSRQRDQQVQLQSPTGSKSFLLSASRITSRMQLRIPFGALHPN